MKTCKSCGQEKDLSEYHKHKDGHRAICKVCRNSQHKAAYQADPTFRERKKEHARNYQAGPGREKANATKGAYHKRHAKKRSAHNKVAHAVRRGTLQKGPCEVCGALKVVGHHDDYDRPLEVRWLCEDHHKEWHLANGEAANPD